MQIFFFFLIHKLIPLLISTFLFYLLLKVSIVTSLEWKEYDIPKALSSCKEYRLYNFGFT